MLSYKEIWQQGQDARSENKCVCENPYYSTPEKGRIWYRGYMHLETGCEIDYRHPEYILYEPLLACEHPLQDKINYKEYKMYGTHILNGMSKKFIPDIFKEILAWDKKNE